MLLERIHFATVLSDSLSPSNTPEGIGFLCQSNGQTILTEFNSITYFLKLGARSFKKTFQEMKLFLTVYCGY